MKNIQRCTFNLKIFVLLALSLTLTFANTNSKNWKYKDWEVVDLNKQFLKTTTHGSVIWGHEFGILKSKSSCNINLLWLSMSSSEKDLNILKNKKVPVEINVDDKKYRVNLTVKLIFELTPATTIIGFENLVLNDTFIKDLKKGDQLKLTILESSDLSKKFDFKYEKFSLNGFVANHTKLVEACKDINKLLIPPVKIKLEPKKSKKYDIKNLITDYSKCDNTAINQYIQNESISGSEFTIHNSYLYFSYGNDGQDEYEDINVINICDPKNPKLVTKVSGSASQIFSMYSDDKYIYVDSSTYDEQSNKSDTSFKIIDPKSFNLITKINQETLRNPFVVKKNTLYLVQGKKVKVYDLTNITKPTLENEFNYPLKKFDIDSIDVDDNYIYLTGNSNLMIYNKNTFKLVSNKLFKYRTSGIVVDNNKAIITMWSNTKGRFVSTIDLSDKYNVKIEYIEKSDSSYLRRINSNTIVYGEYSPDVYFPYTNIDDLFKQIINVNKN